MSTESKRRKEGILLLCSEFERTNEGKENVEYKMLPRFDYVSVKKTGHGGTAANGYEFLEEIFGRF